MQPEGQCQPHPAPNSRPGWDREEKAGKPPVLMGPPALVSSGSPNNLWALLPHFSG